MKVKDQLGERKMLTGSWSEGGRRGGKLFRRGIDQSANVELK